MGYFKRLLRALLGRPLIVKVTREYRVPPVPLELFPSDPVDHI